MSAVSSILGVAYLAGRRMILIEGSGLFGAGVPGRIQSTRRGQ